MPACLDGKFESNRDEVQKRIRDGGWEVAFSTRELQEIDLLEGTVAAILSYFTGGTAFSVWLEELIRESLAGMAESIENTFTPAVMREASQFADNVITNLFQGKILGEQSIDLFYVNFKAGLTQYIGQNYTWICNFSREGGFWQSTTGNVISYCPYVGIRLNQSAGSPSPTPPPSLQRLQWLGESEVWYNKHSSGEWHKFIGFQQPRFMGAFQETGRDKNYVYLRSQTQTPGGKFLELALGPDRLFWHYLFGEPGWTPESSGFWRA